MSIPVWSIIVWVSPSPPLQSHQLSINFFFSELNFFSWFVHTTAYTHVTWWQGLIIVTWGSVHLSEGQLYNTFVFPQSRRPCDIHMTIYSPHSKKRLLPFWENLHHVHVLSAVSLFFFFFFLTLAFAVSLHQPLPAGQLPAASLDRL